jgi:1,4-alpha-glucan branching enzyme
MAPEARSVSLAGDFNAWTSDGSTQLERAPDGTWAVSLALPEGAYEYKFLVDGSWVNDPGNPTKVANCYGTTNDVVKVQALPGGRN